MRAKTIGFTGTRNGMSSCQKEAVKRLLERLQPSQVRHGDCVGADFEFTELCSELDLRPCITAHPGKNRGGPEIHSMQGNSPHNDEVEPVKEFFERNRDIVDNCDVLIATPFTEERRDKGGTWYTIGYAEKKHRILYVISPSGAMTKVTPFVDWIEQQAAFEEEW